MFPLGSVLLPGGALPLHIFEPRYQALVRDCIEAPEHEFGVVLIDRGSEVGGGESRRDVGVVARMVQVAQLADDRFAVVAVGTRRIRVIEWLPEDPYPRAVVEDLTDRADEAGDALVADVTRRARQFAAEDAPTEHDGGVFAIADLVPLGAADRYDVLCATSDAERWRVLNRALADVEAAVEFRMKG
ncbi:LON peptidase substrate-binding domain-containing protein [soil metagenome]